jgi:glycosyltransferase 2 family protein
MASRFDRMGRMAMMGRVKRLLGSRWLKLAVVVVVVALAVYKIDGEWKDVHEALVKMGFLACFEALLALLVMQFATLMQWRALLTGIGSKVSVPTAARIFFIGQLGKYIPGSVWPVLTQMELGARANIPRERAAGASILTMILSVATALLVAAATLPFAHLSFGYTWVFAFVPVILICLYPKVLNPLLNLLFKLVKRPGLDQPVTLTVLLRALGWSLFAFIANGVQIWILADKLGASGGRIILVAIGGYAFAWCMGFVIIFTPAGAGVRDVLLIVFLTPLIGGSNALAVSLVSRGVNTISDLLVAGLAAASRNRGKENVALSAPSPGLTPAPVTVPTTDQISSSS